MDQISDTIKTFFEDFERKSNTFESDLAIQFSDPFMIADPGGGTQIVKREDFIASISKRQTFFQSIGFQWVKIIVFDETRLDDHYAMVKAHVNMRFTKGSGQYVDLMDNATYLLYIKDDSPRIVFYLTHEDLMKIMRKQGLWPPQ